MAWKCEMLFHIRNLGFGVPQSCVLPLSSWLTCPSNLDCTNAYVQRLSQGGLFLNAGVFCSRGPVSDSAFWPLSSCFPDTGCLTFCPNTSSLTPSWCSSSWLPCWAWSSTTPVPTGQQYHLWEGYQKLWQLEKFLLCPGLGWYSA